MLSESKFYFNTLSCEVITKIVQGRVAHPSTLQGWMNKRASLPVFFLFKLYVIDRASHNICLIFFLVMSLTFKSSSHVCNLLNLIGNQPYLFVKTCTKKNKVVKLRKFLNLKVTVYSVLIKIYIYIHIYIYV